MLKSLTKNQKLILLVLSSVNLINYLDRQVVFPLFSHIKIEFNLSDFQLGLLGTVFLLTHSLASVPLGLLADKYSRRKIISVSVFLWSIASFASGLSKSFHQLLFTRGLVGLGEAGYAPAASAMITDNFDQNTRGKAQGIFNVGMFVGGTLGAMIGGLVAYYFDSWRLAFFLVSIPGIVCAFLASKIIDHQKEHDEPHVSFLTLFKNPAYISMVASGALISFAAGGLIAWSTEFITRYKGFNLRDASVFLGFNLMVAGVLGVLVGSYLADKLNKHFNWGRALLISLSLIVGAPFFYLGLQDIGGGPFFFTMFFMAVFLTSFYHGPQVVAMHDVVPKRLRASSVAVYFLVVHLFGDTAAPAVVGWISDHASLKLGMEIATSTILLGGIVYIPVCYLIAKKKIKVHED